MLDIGLSVGGYKYKESIKRGVIFLVPMKTLLTVPSVVVFVWFKCFNFSPFFFLEKILCV